MKPFYRLCFLFIFMAFTLSLAAQWQDRPLTTPNPPVKVAVFAPLYLQEAFNGYDYKLGKSSLPRHILPGLEFYNGVMLAIDSLNKDGVNAEVKVYDIKNDSYALSQVIKGNDLNEIGLIIAAVTTPGELKLLGDVARKKNIPFISATYPNYVGISQNPNFILLNSSLNTHIDGLYKYLQRNHAIDQIIALKKPGNAEDYIQKLFNDLIKQTPSIPLKINWVNVQENVSDKDLLPHMDSTKNNIILVASPLESFGVNVVKALSANSNYPATAIGMPTWDAVKAFNRRDHANVDIVYSTPFNYANNQELNSSIVRYYRGKFFSRPSDMVFKGFETTYHFTRLLAKHKDSLLQNLSDESFTIFNQFNIRPVKLRATNPQPDFMENKKLYFITKREGSVVSIK